MLLNELDFRDLYIRIDEETNVNTTSRYHKKPKIGDPHTFGNFAVPREFNERIHELRKILRDSKKNNCSIDFDEIRMRVVRYPTVNDETWTCLRRIATKLPVLSELNFEDGLVDIFRSWGKRAGLIIIGGSTGSGKTTTAVGMINEWMNSFGGTLYTIEDPVEYLIQGEMGKNGFIIQREVEEDSEWAENIKDALRSAPDYIFVGEVRDAKAARQLLRAATSGHLVLCTVHGSSIAESLSAIVQNAEQELGEMAYTLLAQGLTGVIYQTIQRGRPVVEIVETMDGNNGVDNVRQNIRAQKLNMLGTEIERQKQLRRKIKEKKELQSESEGDEGGNAQTPSSQNPQRIRPTENRRPENRNPNISSQQRQRTEEPRLVKKEVAPQPKKFSLFGKGK